MKEAEIECLNDEYLDAKRITPAMYEYFSGFHSEEEE